MRTKLLSGAIVGVSINCLALSGPPIVRAEPSSPCKTETATEYTMVIQSPCSPTLVKANQTLNPSLLNVAITDANATVHPKIIPIQVQAPGLVNVEIWTQNKMAMRLVNDGTGTFRGKLDLGSEPNGPVVIAVYAWNKPLGDNSYTVKLAAMMTLFVIGGKDAVIPLPAPAAGMTLHWSDEFDALSATPCKPNTGTWPKCSPPTALNGCTWYENKPDAKDFGDAAFEHTDSPYNPYRIRNGFLRIRSQFDPGYIDPYGYNRKWYGGLLATAFPDGTSILPTLGNGYYEARVLVPYAATPGNNNASGGTWPGFWMLTRNALQPGSTSGDIEEDITEWYGIAANYFQSWQHVSGNATGQTAPIYANFLPTDLTWDFHRYGMLITDTTVTSYLDDRPLGSLPRGQLMGQVSPQWFLMLDFAMGSGWPINPPPAGYFDMWVDYVKYYRLKGDSRRMQSRSMTRPRQACEQESHRREAKE